MPTCESNVKESTSWLSPRTKDILGLLATTLLCLPSLTGGVALVVSHLLYGDMAEWEQTSAAIVALGVLIGAPMTVFATVLSGILVFSRTMTMRMRYAHLVVVSMAASAALSLLLRFGSLSPTR